jgi:hypothetical protein
MKLAYLPPLQLRFPEYLVSKFERALCEKAGIHTFTAEIYNVTSYGGPKEQIKGIGYCKYCKLTQFEIDIIEMKKNESIRTKIV